MKTFASLVVPARPVISLGLLALLTVLLGACSNTPIATPTAPPAPMAVAAPVPVARAAPSAAAQPTPSSSVATVSLPPYLDPKSDIATGRSVYFDFDMAVVKPEFSTLVERHGKLLMSNPKLAIKIEGNTDDRGSSEYNLALGQKRADAVRSALKLYGVGEAQMEAISWGSERPRTAGHDESGWAQNRRADLQYPTR